MSEICRYSDALRNALEHRYAMFGRPRDGSKNIVCDVFLPYNLIHNASNNIPTTGQFISRWFSAMHDRRAIPISDLCSLLGFKPTQIKDLLLRAKRKEKKICFVGFGGTGINTAFWLKEMCEEHNVVNLFKEIAVFDNDNFEISNLLRLPFNPEAYTSSSINKAKYGEAFKMLSKNNLQIRSMNLTNYDLDGRYYNNWIEDYIYYGAPDIETRELFMEHNKTLICATHGNSDCTVAISQEQNSSLQVESYGMINLSTFFMNQVRMAIELLRIIGEEDYSDGVKLDFNFETLVKEDRLGKASKTYNFYIEHSGLVGDVQ